MGRVVFRLALRRIPAGQPLSILVDDTLVHKTGTGIALATIHHDPLLSSARTPFCRFGHVCVVLTPWAPWLMGGARHSSKIASVQFSPVGLAPARCSGGSRTGPIAFASIQK